ncbi:fibroblast growth factor receptor-like 1 [Dinothrombium tinctorium]|uniref:receptor protein-tyrosine kinase n=1 Tax=Dinothrombium tinctorium TaxID=1965070 RepID=A0A443QSZ0_9ACAR|nr:fibroblast growth factor receptor-like 1 [Dinothrombium tinctorium]RWS06493.1 fibroblast growth factor receptor-like 1 [Dinothrombium tinctorium]RWS15575.1 fibroblast growth factor receptor-like 1 [Dinothrombium tinctorium]
MNGEKSNENDKQKQNLKHQRLAANCGEETGKKCASQEAESSGHLFAPIGKPILHHVLPNDRRIERAVGSTLKLKCLPWTTHPKPYIIWYKNGTPLKVVLIISMKVEESSKDSLRLPSERRRGHWTLILQKLKNEDTGNYTCTVTNEYGSVNVSFFVIVYGFEKNAATTSSALIVSSSLSSNSHSHPTNTTIEYGSKASFQCTVVSQVSPHIQVSRKLCVFVWLKKIDTDDANAFVDSSPTTSNQNVDTTKSGSAYNPERGHILRIQDEFFRVLESSEVVKVNTDFFINTLIIVNAKESDSGKYICLCVNEMGYSFRSAFLTVLPEKHKPHALISSRHHHRYRHESLYSPLHSHPGVILVCLPILIGVAIAVVVVCAVNCYKKRNEPSIPDFPDDLSAIHFNKPNCKRHMQLKQRLAKRLLPGSVRNKYTDGDNLFGSALDKFKCSYSCLSALLRKLRLFSKRKKHIIYTVDYI